jgi:magnesium transporter
VIQIYYLDRGLHKAKPEDLHRIKKKPVWVDITDLTHDEAKLISQVFELHPLTEEDLSHNLTRIKVEEFPHYLLLVFYGIHKDTRMRLVELDFVLGKNFLISSHKNPMSSCQDLTKDEKEIQHLLSKGPDFLMHKILDHEIDNYFPILEKIDDYIERIEERITKNPRPELLHKILRMKRTIVIIKRVTFQQREKLSFLAKNNYAFITKSAIPYYRDVYDHFIRISDALDNYREAVQNAFDIYLSAVSNRMNEVMKALSIIATIALPLTAISSIYGTNFHNLPGAQYWWGFWAMLALMACVSIFMMVFFRKRKWL